MLTVLLFLGVFFDVVVAAVVEFFELHKHTRHLPVDRVNFEFAVHKHNRRVIACLQFVDNFFYFFVEFFELHKRTRHFPADSVSLSLHCTRISSGYFCDRKQTLACFGVFSVCIFKSISYCPLVVVFWFVFLFLVSFSFVF